ncbi:MAG TPA: hypothetical protein VIV14_11730, partial [Gammaproteobacteria bacterium]
MVVRIVQRSPGDRNLRESSDLVGAALAAIAVGGKGPVATFIPSRSLAELVGACLAGVQRLAWLRNKRHTRPRSVTVT